MLPVDRNVESAAKMSVPSRATFPPLRVQPRHDALEREPVPFLKSPFAYAVVCARLRVAVGTQANYGVVGCIMLIPPSESRDCPVQKCRVRGALACRASAGQQPTTRGSQPGTDSGATRPAPSGSKLRPEQAARSGSLFGTGAPRLRIAPAPKTSLPRSRYDCALRVQAISSTKSNARRNAMA
jgi:hypothetical protein